MEITEVRIKLMDEPGERLKAFCSITFDDCFVIRDLKIIEGGSGPFVAMPSRKLTSHCPKCGMKNHLRAQYCNQCSTRLEEGRAPKDTDGRAKLYADIAHPINCTCREMIQHSVIGEYELELERAKQPGYVSRYDDYDVDYEEPARNRAARVDQSHDGRAERSTCDAESGQQPPLRWRPAPQPGRANPRQRGAQIQTVGQTPVSGPASSPTLKPCRHKPSGHWPPPHAWRRACWFSLAILQVASIGCQRAAQSTSAAWVPTQIADQAMQQLDTDGDGRLRGDEIRACPGLAQALTVIDRDLDRALSQAELAERFDSYRAADPAPARYQCEVYTRGAPLAGATLRLVPESFFGDALPPAEGVVDENGLCSPTSAGAESGVWMGIYRVHVDTSPDGKAPAKPATILGIEVVEGGQLTRSGTTPRINVP